MGVRGLRVLVATVLMTGLLGGAVAQAVVTDPTYSWGRNREGQLGNGGVLPDSVDTPTSQGRSFTRVSAGSAQACGLDAAGAAYCWGTNGWGRLGVGFSNSSYPYVLGTPTVIPSHTFTDISVWSSICALKASGQAYCWGDNVAGQLGVGDTTRRTSPTEVADGHTFRDISSGFRFTCGLTVDKTYCWGSNSSGQIGSSVGSNTTIPVEVPLPAGVTLTQISAGSRHACGLTAGGQAYCWGDNTYGELGLGDTTARTAPTAVPILTFASISAGANYTCAITADSASYCWGYGYTRNLGNGGGGDRTSPTAVQLPDGVTLAQIEADKGGYPHTCGLATTGTAYCWGYNSFGQLGIGGTATQPTPQPVSGTYAALSVGDSFTLATTAIAPLTPMYDAPVGTADGFTVDVNNYNAAYGWSVSATSGTAAIDSSGTITVTGLSAGASSTVTTTTTRSGYPNGTSSITGSALTCATGGTCVVGETGPAGGIVFYVSPTVIDYAPGVSDGGLYLEAAPSGYAEASWTGQWCTDTTTLIGTSSSLGQGAINTKAVIDSGLCTTSPMQVAADATIGGFSDWFVPSQGEGSALITYANTIGLTNGYFYWESSESANWVAGTINQSGGTWYSTGGSNKNDASHHVWPVRAFGGSLSTALTPTFDTPVRTTGGFTVNVTNYDAAYTWTPTVSAGSVAAGTAAGSTLPLTVTGLSGGQSATVTVGTAQGGFADGSATVSGQAKSTQTVTWAPTSAIATVDSPLTPSSTATSDGDGAVTFAVTSHTTTTCTVDTNTGNLTYTGTGDCTVRATAEATSSYLQGTKDVTFTVTKAAQVVTWAPTMALTMPATTVTPTAASVPAGGGTISYTVTSAGSTGCTFISGQLAYTAIGDCTVRATATSSDLYDAGYTDVTFTITRATPTLTWSPTTAVDVPDGSTTFAAAATSGDGAISYMVTDAGTTGCSLPSSTSQVLSFSAEGSCQVTATAAQTDDYAQVTSVKTFAVSKVVQSVSWSPTSTLTLASLSASLGSGSTSGDGAVTYSVSSAGGTGCAFADSSSPTLTYSAAGTCTVMATAAATTGYAQGTTSTAIAITTATPTFSWSPTTAWSLPAATVTPGAATTDGDGAVTYAITSDTGAGCAVSPTTGALSYTGIGQCVVTATSASTTRYASASTAETFTIGLASQTISASATSTTLRPGQTATVSDSGSTGTGSIIWTRTSGTGVCTLSGTTVTAVADGTCVLTVTIAADATYAAASDTITLTVATPAPPGGGGSGGGGSGGGGGSSSSTTSPPQDSSPATSSSSGTGQGHSSATAETPEESVPGTSTPTRAIGLPPAPIQVKVTPMAKKTRAKVLVGLPAGSAGASVLSTVVVVRDAKGKVVSRIELPVKKGQQQAEVIVPYVADGYTVNVYNVNEVGVSTGAIRTSPLVHATTITRRGAMNSPALFGNRLGRSVIFNAGSTWLDPEDRRQLDAIARQAKASNQRLFITGFARKGGGRNSELAALSTKRARTVATYLAKKGVRVWIRYWGAGSLNGTGKASDRRVEIRTSSAAIPRSLVP